MCAERVMKATLSLLLIVVVVIVVEVNVISVSQTILLIMHSKNLTDPSIVLSALQVCHTLYSTGSVTIDVKVNINRNQTLNSKLFKNLLSCLLAFFRQTWK